jgi:decaprenylphospho-beta-D-ribofuranose 2-oxidase
LAVRKWTVPNLEEMLHEMEELRRTAPYHIGWVDCFTRGKNFGRGTIHAAEFVDRPSSKAKETNDFSYISPYLFGVFPRSWLWPVLKPFFGNTLMRFTNATKYAVDRLTTQKTPHYVNFFEFNFLLDKIPNWRQLFTPNGYCELEPIIPFAACGKVFRELIELTQVYGNPTILTAIKSHRKDDFLLSYSIDGCTIGIDVPIDPRRKSDYNVLFHRMNDVVVKAGGKAYLAKDEKLTAEHFKSMYPTWPQFVSLKKREDPGALFQSDMYRRLFSLSASNVLASITD